MSKRGVGLNTISLVLSVSCPQVTLIGPNLEKKSQIFISGCNWQLSLSPLPNLQPQLSFETLQIPMRSRKMRVLRSLVQSRLED